MEKIVYILDQIKDGFTQNWMEIGISLIIVIAFIILSPLLSYAILKIFNIKKNKQEIKKISFYKPLKFIFITIGFYIASWNLSIPGDVMINITKVFKIILIVLVAKGFANMANPETHTFKTLQGKLDFMPNKKATGFICRIIKILIYIIAGFLIITELGYNLNGLAAGLGIGSAILALAVQDVAKNLLGGVTIITDKVFIVGDYIEVGEYEGTVEDITFRSTRIRTMDGTQVTIPNGTLANTYVVNYAGMKQRRIKVNLTLDFSVPYADLERVKNRIALVFSDFPNIIKDSLNINYTEITGEGTELFIYMYTDKVKYAEFLKVESQVNEAILQIFEKENITLELRDHIELEN